MLAHLTTGFTVGLILLNLAGLTLAARRWCGSYALAKVASPLALALVMFFAEHFVGLGRLAWAWPLTTAGAVWAIAREREHLLDHWRSEAAFLAAFAWAFAWRISYPGLVASSEKIGDLAMISAYLPGDRLPPQDAWYPPYAFDVYYSFHSYAAALLGRVFDLGPGMTYNLAFCLLMALTMTAAAAFAYRVCGKTVGTVLVVLAFAGGGTGATLPVRFMMTDPQLHSSMRFIGGTATPKFANTPFGQALAATHTPVAGTERLELPDETFAYLLALGDYHSPLGGFFLLMLGMLCLAAIETGGAARVSQAILAATPVLCTVANGWTLPLQLGLVLAWVAYRVSRRRAPDWRWLAGGALAAAVLCHPFLSSYAYRASDYAVRLRPVRWNEHTPAILGAIQLYPIVAAAILPLLFGERKRWIVWSSALWLAMLAASELVFVDDVYSGAFNRFNTTLKWWPWIQAGTLLASGAYAMRSRSRALRVGMTVILLLVSVFAFDMTRGLVTGKKVDFGRLDGTFWITQDNVERAILEFLKAQPRSIVLQRPEAGAFTPAPGLILLAGQTAFLGWSEHEKLWRGQRVDVEQRARDVAAFYAGELPDGMRWLLHNRIDHVLWLKTEAKAPPGTFERIDEAIGQAYFWQEYYRVGDFRVGVWSRTVPLVPLGQPTSSSR